MEVLKKSQSFSKRTPRSSKAQGTSKPISHVYKFGSFRLEQAERVLLRGAETVPLTPKVFDTLVVLLESAGRLVTKEILLEEIWPDTFVEEANLSVNMATLRKALGEGRGERQYIETISKRGYRFVANVVEVGRKPAVTVSTQEVRTAPQGNTISLRQGSNSLAVLPFDNESANPDADYLSDGLTESIINNLSQLQNLRVVARNTVFRYWAKERDPQKAGLELGVGLVLSGRILQLGNRLIIRAELIDVFNGCQIWDEQYHRKLSDILAVQEEISEAISATLRVQLTRKEKNLLAKRQTENAEAYQNYLKGRYHWNKFHPISLKRAINYFEQAIEIDPTYALAYAGLADTYYRLSNVYASTREAMPKAKAAAIKALEIDETLSEAHAALGLIKLFYEWDWLAAKEEFAHAIEINPNYAVAHQRCGLYFNLLGRFDEGMRELELGLAIDPLSPQIYWSYALAFFLAGKYEQAVEEIQKTLEMERDYQPALYLLGRSYEEVGQLSEAIAVLENLLNLNDAPMFLAELGRAYALAGKHQEARKVLNDLNDQSKQRYVSAYSRAAVYLALDDKIFTLACLEQAYEERCEMMTWLKVDPAFNIIRTDLSFLNLVGRVGLDGEYVVQTKCAVS